MESNPEKDFFISYTQADRHWAEWVAWELEEAGYAVIIQAWDFKPGSNFLEQMDAALKESGRTLLILTPAALGSRYVAEEWTTALKKERLVPVRVQDCDPEGLLSVRAYIDLVGFEEEKARMQLLAQLDEERAKPETKPVFPTTAPKPAERNVPQRPAFPGTLPPFWQVPHRRNPAFTGRESLLDELHRALTSGEVAALTQAIAGLGGIGKTQLALEYSYRHAHEYAGLWWFRAETPETLVTDYAALANAAQLPERESADREATVEAVRRWLAGQEKPWLLVFDNTTGPDNVRDYLPKRAFHHVLVTSRNPAFRGIAKPLEVKVFEREESSAFLLKRTSSGEQGAANVLADELGDLPLALEQAGAYVETAGLSLSEYIERYRAHHTKLLARGNLSTDYPDTLATTWSLAFEAVESASPAGSALLNVLAFLAPDAIPKALIVAGAEHLPKKLAEAIEDGLALDEAVAALRRYSLIETTGELWSVHRLVQAVTRDRLSDDAAPWAEAALELVNHVFSYKQDDLSTWGPSEALLPHALTTAEYAEEHDVGLKIAAKVLNAAALYLQNCAQLTEAHSVFKRALGIYEQVHGAEHGDVAAVVNNIGAILKDQGDLSGALSHAKRALTIAEQVYGPEHPKVAMLANNIGQILKDQGDLSGALSYAKRALAIDEQAYGIEHPSVARNANNISAILLALGELKEALSYAKRALAIVEQVYGPKHPNVAKCANNIGQILNAQGDLKGALSCAERALAIDEMVYGPENGSVAIDANNVGLILRAQGEFESALSYVRRALAIDEKVYGLEHPSVATAANNVGLILLDKGDLKGAFSYIARALAIDEKVYGPEHHSVARDASNIGRILLDQGDLKGAHSHAARALAIDEKVYGPEHPKVAKDANNMGRILLGHGDLDQALSYAERALAIDEQVYGPEHISVARDVHTIGLILHDKGKPKLAASYYQRALKIFNTTLGPAHPHTQLVAGNLASIETSL